MAIIKGRLGAVYIAQYGAGATAFTKEAMTANVAKTVFTIDAAAKRFWDPDTAVLVYYNDSLLTPATLGVPQYPGGVVTWASTPGNDAVTVSGKYLAIAEVGQCRSWTLDFATEFADVTEFGDLYRVQVPLIRNGTATMESFYADSTLFAEMISTNPRIGVDLFLDDTPGSEVRYTGYGTLGSINVTVDASGVIEQPFTINFSDGPYYVAGLA